MFKKLKAFFAKIAAWFKSGQAQKDFDVVCSLVPQALPYIEIAAEIGAGLTPTKLDDVALAAIKLKYPQLFDGSMKSGEEVKLFLLSVATDLLKTKFPAVSTSIARTAVQVAYTGMAASAAPAA